MPRTRAVAMRPAPRNPIRSDAAVIFSSFKTNLFEIDNFLISWRHHGQANSWAFHWCWGERKQMCVPCWPQSGLARTQIKIQETEFVWVGLRRPAWFRRLPTCRPSNHNSCPISPRLWCG